MPGDGRAGGRDEAALTGCGAQRLRERLRRRPARTKGGQGKAAPRGRGGSTETEGCGAMGSGAEPSESRWKVWRGPLAAICFVWRNNPFGDGMRRAAP